MRILAIDGGGIRGIIPALVLADLEARTGRPVSDLFDLIAGTSTGGILACALARPGVVADSGGATSPGPRYTAAELVSLYLDEGPRIFDRSLLHTVQTVGGLLGDHYDDHGLRAVLHQYFGDTPLSEARTDVLLTAYEIEQRFAFFFRSSRARTDASADFLMAEAARATAAAPTYFAPMEIRDLAGAGRYALVDGGVFANNPAMCALAEVGEGVSGVTALLSLGTGRHTRPIPYSDARGWGTLGWAPHILDVVFDGVSETVDYEVARLLGERYTRIQTSLAHASDDLDDTSSENLAALTATGRALVAERAADLDRMAERLVTAAAVG